MKKNTSKKIEQILSIINSEESSFKSYNPSTKAILHKENFIRFLKGKDLEIKPVTMETVLSLECNQRCSRCTYWQNQAKLKPGTNRLMSEETFDKLLLQLKDFPETKSMIFAGGGEPMMNPNCVRFIRKATQKGFKIALFTNGTLFTQKRIDDIIDIGTSIVRISLNAGTLKTHASMFGYDLKKDYFSTVIDNITKLAISNAKNNYKTNLGIGVIISEKNCSEISEIADLIIKINKLSKGGISNIAFRPEIAYFDKNLEVVTSQPNKDIFANISDKIEKEIGEKMRFNNINLIVNRFGFKHLSSKYQNVPNIVTPWVTCCDYDGKLHIMTEYNGMDKYCFGDINKESISEAWSSQKRKDFVSDMSNNKIKSLPYYKLLPLNKSLYKIRQEVGILSDKEIKALYTRLPKKLTDDYAFI